MSTKDQSDSNKPVGLFKKGTGSGSRPEPDLKLVEAAESRTPQPRCNLPVLLVRLLDQLATLGETAAQIKKAFKEGTLRDI